MMIHEKKTDALAEAIDKLVEARIRVVMLAMGGTKAADQKGARADVTAFRDAVSKAANNAIREISTYWTVALKEGGEI